MNRRLLGSLLIAALLWQGAAQAAVAASPQPTAEQDCAGHMAVDDGCGCCPDGAMDASSCQLSCAGIVALTTPTITHHTTHTMAPEVRVNQPRAGPRYLPLNPPPIA